jgi:hypothetical protein
LAESHTLTKDLHHLLPATLERLVLDQPEQDWN